MSRRAKRKISKRTVKEMLTAVPYNPEIMMRLLEGGADPDANGWSTEILDFEQNDLWILDMWILDYGWRPGYRDGHSDPSRVFRKLALHKRWVAATVLLDHFGTALDVCGTAHLVLSESARVYRKNDVQAQFNFVMKMVDTFPGALQGVVDWYQQTKWTLDPCLLETLMD
ncbi:hypothetical protein HK102_008673 [Quaeritorhiza haematococci]|nr:hypothetical protein HK102_008673 [Quaeritorhiza haematococci]